MKKQNYLLIIMLSFLVLPFSAQIASFDDWQAKAQKNINLQPKYGNATKSEAQQKADQKLISGMISQYGTRERASSKLIEQGFQSFYKKNLEGAMTRFNEAYMLNPDNSDVYWAYGMIYSNFEEYALARKQYDEGLQKNPKNDRILVDYGNSYLSDYYIEIYFDTNSADTYLDKAISKLHEAYGLNPKNAKATYLLTVSYLLKNQCKVAQKYYKLTEQLNASIISTDTKNSLKTKCR